MELNIQLTKEGVTKHIIDKQDELYTRYANIDVTKRLHSSPLRVDKHPSFEIYKKNDWVLWRDYATGEQGDIYTLIMYKEKVSFYEALVMINNDYELGFKYSENYKKEFTKTIIQRTNSNISKKSNTAENTIELKFNTYKDEDTYTRKDIQYWKSMFITPDVLKEERVKSVQTVYYNKVVKWVYMASNPIYAYVEEDPSQFKLYRPFNYYKEGKWLSTLKNSAKLYGNFDITKPLILTKSKKDYMILKYVLEENCGYVQSEAIYVSLPSNTIVLFDNDKTGILKANELAEQQKAKAIFFDPSLGKDVAEVTTKLDNLTQLKELWKQMKNQ